MTSRKPDNLRIEAIGSDNVPFDGSFDVFNTFEVTNDITQPSQATFDVGDDLTWGVLEPFFTPGAQYRVFVNDRLRLTGRVEANSLPMTSDRGTSVSYVVRTKLADAQYASGSPLTRVRSATLEQFILDAYSPLGYTEADFVFDQSAARDQLIGKVQNEYGEEVTLQKDVERAQFNPPETIFAGVDRHLRRLGLMHWDSPDGKIVVGAPNDSQDPIYKLRAAFSGFGFENNILSATRNQDWSQIPALIGVFGHGSKQGFTKAKVKSVRKDEDVNSAGFYRPVLILADGVKTQAEADRAVARELSARSRAKDAWNVTVDGLSWWNGNENIPFAPDAVAEIESGSSGGPLGAYYIHRVSSRRTPSEGDTTSLSLLKRGIWVL
jgi:prophage tail gpP-like protein